MEDIVGDALPRYFVKLKIFHAQRKDSAAVWQQHKKQIENDDFVIPTALDVAVDSPLSNAGSSGTRTPGGSGGRTPGAQSGSSATTDHVRGMQKQQDGGFTMLQQPLLGNESGQGSTLCSSGVSFAGEDSRKPSREKDLEKPGFRPTAGRVKSSAAVTVKSSLKADNTAFNVGGGKTSAERASSALLAENENWIDIHDICVSGYEEIIEFVRDEMKDRYCEWEILTSTNSIFTEELFSARLTTSRLPLILHVKNTTAVYRKELASAMEQVNKCARDAVQEDISKKKAYIERLENRIVGLERRVSDLSRVYTFPPPRNIIQSKNGITLWLLVLAQGVCIFLYVLFIFERVHIDIVTYTNGYNDVVRTNVTAAVVDLRQETNYALDVAHTRAKEQRKVLDYQREYLANLVQNQTHFQEHLHVFRTTQRQNVHRLHELEADTLQKLTSLEDANCAQLFDNVCGDVDDSISTATSSNPSDHGSGAIKDSKKAVAKNLRDGSITTSVVTTSAKINRVASKPLQSLPSSLLALFETVSTNSSAGVENHDDPLDSEDTEDQLDYDITDTDATEAEIDAATSKNSESNDSHASTDDVLRQASTTDSSVTTNTHTGSNNGADSSADAAITYTNIATNASSTETRADTHTNSSALAAAMSCNVTQETVTAAVHDSLQSRQAACQQQVQASIQQCEVAQKDLHRGLTSILQIINQLRDSNVVLLNNITKAIVESYDYLDFRTVPVNLQIALKSTRIPSAHKKRKPSVETSKDTSTKTSKGTSTKTTSTETASSSKTSEKMSENDKLKQHSAAVMNSGTQVVASQEIKVTSKNMKLMSQEVKSKGTKFTSKEKT